MTVDESSSGRWIVRSERPAARWEDAFVTGNGRHGCMVMGQTDTERIICVHEELFVRSWDRDKQAVADIAHLLPEVRRLIETGNPQAAQALAVEEGRRQLVDMGAPQDWPLSPHPAFDLNIDYGAGGAPIDYHRQLDLENGETLTRWAGDQSGIEQRVFSSQAHNVNVVALKGTHGHKLNLRLSLAETPGRKGSNLGIDLGNAFRAVHRKATAGWLAYEARYRADRGGYDGLARITLTGGTLSSEGSVIRVSDADDVLIVLRITPLEDGEASDQAAVARELSALPTHYPDLLTPHARKHGEMFRRVTLDLGAATQWAATPTEQLLAQVQAHGICALFLEQAHAMGRYMLISASGKYPAPLQGIWGASWTPAWVGGFVLDSNLNLAISSAAMGGLAECAESYFGYVERLLDGWRLNARKYLGVRGFLVPHYSDPQNGHLNHFVGMYAWMYWPGGAGWNIRPFYDYALLAGNRSFMQKRVLPLYLEMAGFYEDYLVTDAQGYHHINPSISPENCPSNLPHAMVLRDSTFDIAVAREVFQILIELGHRFELPSQDIAKWKAMRDALPAYRINADGALAEWAPPEYEDNYSHRHNSHLYPVFPGMEFLQADADPALLQATRVALDKRFEHDTTSAHGLIHVALMAARLHDTDKIRANLDRLSRRRYHYTSLATSHDPDHHIYNLDATLSLPRLLMEMLVFSRPGHIELLPAWPSGYPDGAIQGVLIHGGHKIDLRWSEGRLAAAVLYAGHDDECVVCCGKARRNIALKAGKTYRFNADLTGHE